MKINKVSLIGALLSAALLVIGLDHWFARLVAVSFLLLCTFDFVASIALDGNERIEAAFRDSTHV